MKVAILMLSYERGDILGNVLDQNLTHAGYPYELFVLDMGSKDPGVFNALNDSANHLWQADSNIGIAAGFNFLLKKAYDMGFHYFQLMGNDILETDKWVSRKRAHFDLYPKSGMVSIPFDKPAVTNQNFLPSFEAGCHVRIDTVIGQFMISREVIESVGFFKEYSLLYGPIDIDYNLRCRQLGFINYYISDQFAQHISSSQPDPYGYDKKEQLKTTWPEYHAAIAEYERTSNYYIPYKEPQANIVAL